MPGRQQFVVLLRITEVQWNQAPSGFLRWFGLIHGRRYDL
jgi:hypothetical protein